VSRALTILIVHNSGTKGEFGSSQKMHGSSHFLPKGEKIDILEGTHQGDDEMTSITLTLAERARLETIEGRPYVYLEGTTKAGEDTLFELSHTEHEYIFTIEALYAHTLEFMTEWFGE
jgi:hypothetical protein